MKGVHDIGVIDGVDNSEYGNAANDSEACVNGYRYAVFVEQKSTILSTIHHPDRALSGRAFCQVHSLVMGFPCLDSDWKDGVSRRVAVFR